MVRIPWKMVIGKMNGPQSSRNCFIQGENENIENFFLNLHALLSRRLSYYMHKSGSGASLSRMYNSSLKRKR
jgi:hypothetical protein